MHWRVLVPRGWRAKAWHFRTWTDFGERLLFLSSICFNAKHHMNLFALVPRGAECCLTEFEWVGLGDSKFDAESVNRLPTGERTICWIGWMPPIPLYRAVTALWRRSKWPGVVRQACSWINRMPRRCCNRRSISWRNCMKRFKSANLLPADATKRFCYVLFMFVHGLKPELL